MIPPLYIYMRYLKKKNKPIYMRYLKRKNKSLRMDIWSMIYAKIYVVYNYIKYVQLVKLN